MGTVTANAGPVAQDIWTLALFLASIFHGGTDRDGTLATQEGHSFDFTSDATNKSYYQISSSLVGFLKCFPCDNARIPLPPAILRHNLVTFPRLYIQLARGLSPDPQFFISVYLVPHLFFQG